MTLGLQLVKVGKSQFNEFTFLFYCMLLYIKIKSQHISPFLVIICHKYNNTEVPCKTGFKLHFMSTYCQYKCASLKRLELQITYSRCIDIQNKSLFSLTMSGMKSVDTKWTENTLTVVKIKREMQWLLRSCSLGRLQAIALVLNEVCQAWNVWEPYKERSLIQFRVFVVMSYVFDSGELRRIARRI